MFHVKDGLIFQKHIGAGSPGYTREEQIEMFFTIRVFVVDTTAQSEIVDGTVQTTHRQKISFMTEFNVRALASIMATMSVRGENADTYTEALNFLRANPIAANPTDGTGGER